MPTNKGRKIPDTNNPVNGQTPGQMVYAYLLSEDVCAQCRAHWSDPHSVLCVNCESTRSAYRAAYHRRKFKKDLKKPTMVELVIMKDSVTNSIQLYIHSDVGTLLRVRGIESIDIKDARRGKAHLTSYRKAA